ncbi:hypothetical protein [Kribbella sp. NPDC000426]|uniref:hypothetical protein n=1 Tax=Kribbella sp. NPDC000426 TaxID=3154255 RepID=UPI003322F0E1
MPVLGWGNPPDTLQGALNHLPTHNSASSGSKTEAIAVNSWSAINLSSSTAVVATVYLSQKGDLTKPQTAPHVYFLYPGNDSNPNHIKARIGGKSYIAYPSLGPATPLNLGKKTTQRVVPGMNCAAIGSRNVPRTACSGLLAARVPRSIDVTDGIIAYGSFRGGSLTVASMARLSGAQRIAACWMVAC